MKAISELRSDLNRAAEEYAAVLLIHGMPNRRAIEDRYRAAEKALDAALFHEATA